MNAFQSIFPRILVVVSLIFVSFVVTFRRLVGIMMHQARIFKQPGFGGSTRSWLQRIHFVIIGVSFSCLALRLLTFHYSQLQSSPSSLSSSQAASATSSPVHSVALWLVSRSSGVYGSLALFLRFCLTFVVALPQFLPVDRQRLIGVRRQLQHLARAQQQLESNRSVCRPNGVMTV
jgi:hypothetical protein